MGAIVKVDKRHYRKIAQENWGLTPEQMVGMHVHHRTPRTQGGTNDASNLYVCSAYYHYYVWHRGELKLNFILSDEARLRGAKAPASPKQKAVAKKQGDKNVREGLVSKAGKIGAAIRWRCTVTGFENNAGGLTRYQNARGIDTSNRVKLNSRN